MLRAIALLLLAMSTGFAQDARPKSPPPWPLLVDPVCPVARRAPWAGTNELRITYFPASHDAKIKDPQTLTLFMAFNGANWVDNKISLPFTHKDDRWEAVVPLNETLRSYAILYVKDASSNQTDDNGGLYWDTVFCNPTGEKDAMGITMQADTYNGRALPFNIQRKADYAKAAGIITSALPSDEQQLLQWTQALQRLWEYQAKRDGDNAEAYAKLQHELEQFMAAHEKNQSLERLPGYFVIRMADKFQPEFVERVVKTLDAKAQNSKNTLREQYDYWKALRVPDVRNRIRAMSAFVAAYPDSMQAWSAQQTIFRDLAGAGDVAAAESAFRHYLQMPRPANFVGGEDIDAANRLDMARLYIDKREKLDEAVKLIDEAERLQKRSLDGGPSWRKESDRTWEAERSLLRARACLALKKPQEALPLAQKALEVRKTGSNYRVLAEAYEAVGDKQKALDAYLEALLLPSNSDLENQSRLEQFYLKNHLGTRQQLESLIGRRKRERFASANYKPQLIDQPAPEFSFTSLKGEKLEAAALRGKTVIANFWSPG